MTSMPKISDIDLSTLDISTLEPDKLDLGTCLQDCYLITQTYEKGAHSTYTEGAVFAPIARMIENTKVFSGIAQQNLASYLRQPAQSANEGGSTGTNQQTDQNLNSFQIGNTSVSLPGSAFGKNLMDWLKDCIPCSGRLLALLELHPNIDLLGILEADLKAKLKALQDLGNLLNNIDIYGDLCSFLSLLNFMCIPDLQRLIVMLTALLAEGAFELDAQINILRALIAPLFTPILMSLTSLLDQFVAIVLSPIQCIIDAINEQTRKLNFEVDAKKPMGELTGGLNILVQNITEAKHYIEQKLHFYVNQIKALLDELNAGDGVYLKIAFKKLTQLRLIFFITAIIMAIAKGQQLCSPGQNPQTADLDNFFNSFLNQNSAFNLWVDPNGEIHVDEKTPNFPDSLPYSGNVLKFEGDTFIDQELAQQVLDTQLALTTPVKAKAPCKLEVTANEVEKVNQWISELNSIK